MTGALGWDEANFQEGSLPGFNRELDDETQNRLFAWVFSERRWLESPKPSPPLGRPPGG